MWHLCRPPVVRFMRGLHSAGRAVAALLLAAATLAAPGWAVPIQAAPALPVAAKAPCSVIVNNTADNGSHSLRDAVACALTGGVVLFTNLANQTITLTGGEIPVTKTLTIDASDSPGVRVDAGNNSRVFNITASDTVTLTALTLQHGHTNGNGGAVMAANNVVLQQVQVLTSTAGGQGGGLYASATATLSGTQFISNTSGASAGGAQVNGNAVVSGGRFERNMCTGLFCQGGGLNVDGLTVTGTQFISNTSDSAGGGLQANSAVAVTNGLFQGNGCTSSDCQGGGLYANTTLALTGTHFISNTSPGYGGGAYANDAAVLTDGVFQGNRCTGSSCRGGGLYAISLMLNGTNFLTNTSQGAGGGAYIADWAVLTNGRVLGNRCLDVGCQGGALNVGSLTLTGTGFISNTSLSDGGGAYAAGAALLTNGLFQGNRCTGAGCEGGGLHADTNLTLTGTQFITNSSQYHGGGVYVGTTALLTNGRFQGNNCLQSGCLGGGLSAFEATLNGTQLISNTSQGNGGGVYILGTATVTNTRFEGNKCIASGCRGAGLYANTSGLVQASSFSANHAGGSGGAVAGGDITLANVTLSGNNADDSGGALLALSGNSLNLYNVTVADNQAPSGPGLLAQAGSTVGINNTIFANNGAANCTGPIANGTHNLQWPGSTCAGAGFTTADPQLLPLALNAPGSTLTRALGPTSPARDHGDASICAAAPVSNRDQRGVARPLNSDLIAGAICDIGAYEAGAPVWQLFLPLVRR